MAITVSTAHVSGTATSGGASTLTDSSKSWTTDAYAKYIVWLTGGTGAGQSRSVVSNTGTVLTVSVPWDTQPDATTTYKIMHNGASLDGSYATITPIGIAGYRTYNISDHINVASGGYLGLLDTEAIMTVDNSLFESASGSFIQLGRLNADGRGVDGGTLHLKHVGSPNYTEANMFGTFRAYGSKIIVHKNFADSENRNIRYNNADTGKDGMDIRDCQFTRGFLVLHENDQVQNTQLFYTNINLEEVPANFANNTSFDCALSPRANNDVAGFKGGLIYDHTFSGDPSSGVTNRPIFIYATASITTEYKATAYWVCPVFLNSSYTTLASATQYYSISTYSQQPQYRLGSLDIDITDEEGDPIEDALITGIDASGNGAFLTAISASSPYGETKSKYIETNASGGYTNPVDGSGDAYPVIEKVTHSSGTPVSTTYGNVTFQVIKYGKIIKSFTKTYDEMKVRGAFSEKLFDNPYISETTQATALAYNFSINWGTGAITTTGNVTADAIQKLHDFLAASYATTTGAGAGYDNPILGYDGVTLTLASGYSFSTGEYSVKDMDRVLADKENDLTVATGGFFEDATGAIKNTAGTLRYLKNVNEIAKTQAAAPIQYAVYAAIDSNGVDRTYSPTLVNGALTTGSDGKASGYYEWKTDSTTHALTKQILCYDYTPIQIPIDANGTPIGTTAVPNVTLLAEDNTTTLDRTGAAAVSGIVVDEGAERLELNDNDLSESMDNVKIRQASTAEIASGLKGYMAYWEYGWLMDFDGTYYFAADGWIVAEADISAAMKNSILELDTPDTYSGLLFNNMQLNFEYDGTYDFRVSDFQGTLTVDTDGDNTVTALFPVDAPAPTNLAGDPPLTVDRSEAFPITGANVPDGAKYFLLNSSTDTYLIDNGEVTGGGGFSISRTFGAGQEILSDHNLILHIELYGKKTLRKEFPAQSGGFSFTESMEDCSIIGVYSIDEATAFSFDYSEGGIYKADIPNLQLDFEGTGIFAWEADKVFCWTKERMYNDTDFRKAFANMYDGSTNFADIVIDTDNIDLKLDNPNAGTQARQTNTNPNLVGKNGAVAEGKPNFRRKDGASVISGREDGGSITIEPSTVVNALVNIEGSPVVTGDIADIPAAVLDAQIADHLSVGSVGKEIKKISAGVTSLK